MLERPTFEIERQGLMLHCAGDADLATARHLACVTGSRRATPYGISLAAESGRIVAESGLALLTTASSGCSVAAARAALEAGGDVVVMGAAGCNVAYPESSRDVFERAGAAMSLAEPAEPPRRRAFASRDRAIAVLAETLVVCECGVPSGVFSLAEEMLGLGARVMAYPGSVYSPTSSGANVLLARGAETLVSTADLARALGCMDARVAIDDDVDDPLLRAVIASPSRANDLARALGVPVLEVLRSLARYEINGVVQRLPDGRYAHVPGRGACHTREGRAQA